MAIQYGKMILSHLGRCDTKYNAQIDNAAKLRKIDNMIVIPLSRGEKEFIGVLHLLNFKGGDIQKYDKEEVDIVAEIITKCISNVNSFNKSLNIMVGIHETMGNAMTILKTTGDSTPEGETKSVGRQLNDEFTQINKLVQELVASRRSQFVIETSKHYSEKVKPS